MVAGAFFGDLFGGSSSSATVLLVVVMTVRVMSPYNLALEIVEEEEATSESIISQKSRKGIWKYSGKVMLSTYTGLLETMTAFMDLTIQYSLVMEQCIVRVSMIRTWVILMEETLMPLDCSLAANPDIGQWPTEAQKESMAKEASLT